MMLIGGKRGCRWREGGSHEAGRGSRGNERGCGGGKRGNNVTGKGSRKMGVGRRERIKNGRKRRVSKEMR